MNINEYLSNLDLDQLLFARDRADKLIEAMAIAAYESEWGPWEDAEDEEKAEARERMAVALAAAEAAGYRMVRDALAELEAENGRLRDHVARLSKYDPKKVRPVALANDLMELTALAAGGGF